MDYLELIWLIASAIGGVKLLTWILPWLYYKLFCCINLSHYKYGYVLITGSSDGIGKALAYEFARRGFNLILISRTLSKLESLKSDLNSLYPSLSIQIISSDFSSSHKDPVNFYHELFNKFQQYEVSILVNNVGAMDNHSLVNSKFEDLEYMISVNVYPSTHLTHKLMNSFLDRYKERKLKSLVINLSSTADESVACGICVYAACKRFNAFFSEGLRYEYSGIVDFVTVKPGPIQTELAAILGDKVPMMAKADDYARALVGGLRKGVNHGHWKSKVLGTSIRIWPYLMNIGTLRMILPSAVKSGMIKL